MSAQRATRTRESVSGEIRDLEEEINRLMEEIGIAETSIAVKKFAELSMLLNECTALKLTLLKLELLDAIGGRRI